MDHIHKLLARISAKHRLQIDAVLSCLYDPACAPTLRAEKLSGSRLYRIRSGAYRVLFHYDANGKTILDDIRPRDEGTYRDL